MLKIFVYKNITSKYTHTTHTHSTHPPPLVRVPPVCFPCSTRFSFLLVFPSSRSLVSSFFSSLSRARRFPVLSLFFFPPVLSLSSSLFSALSSLFPLPPPLLRSRLLPPPSLGFWMSANE